MIIYSWPRLGYYTDTYPKFSFVSDLQNVEKENDAMLIINEMSELATYRDSILGFMSRYPYANMMVCVKMKPCKIFLCSSYTYKEQKFIHYKSSLDSHLEHITNFFLSIINNEQHIL